MSVTNHRLDDYQQKIEYPAGMANLVEIQFAHHRAEFQIGLPELTDRTSGIGLEVTLLVLDFAFNRVGFNKLTTLYTATINFLKRAHDH